MENKISDPEIVAIGTLDAFEGSIEQKKIAAEYKIQYLSQLEEKQRLELKMYAIQLRMESYLEKEDVDKILPVGQFIKEYLSILNISQARMAKYFGLPYKKFNKYLNGNVKSTAILAMKIAKTLKIPVKLLLEIEIKNELLSIEKKEMENFDKYTLDELISVP